MSRRFIVHWEGRSIPRRGTIKLFTLFPDEALAAYRFSVRASIAHLLYHQNLDPICVALRPISGYAPLRSPCTTPTPLHSLLGNSDAKFPDSDPLRRNSGSGLRHLSPAPTCPRPLARSTLEHNRTLRRQREEPHPPLPTSSTVLRISGFTDPHGAME